MVFQIFLWFIFIFLCLLWFLFELGGWRGHYPTKACFNPNISNTLIIDVQRICKALKWTFKWRKRKNKNCSCLPQSLLLVIPNLPQSLLLNIPNIGSFPPSWDASSPPSGIIDASACLHASSLRPLHWP